MFDGFLKNHRHSWSRSSQISTKNSTLPAEPFEPGDDTLLVVLTGLAPVKIQQQIQEKFGLSYREIPSLVSGIRVYLELAAPPVPSTQVSEADPDAYSDTVPASWLAEHLLLESLSPSEDIYIQAVSNGRREMDKVLEAKERLATQHETGADVAEGIAMVSSQFGIFGLPVTLIALAAGTSATDKAAKADILADLRYVSAIPGRVFLACIKAPQQPVRIDALDRYGGVVCSKAFEIQSSSDDRLNVIVIRVYH